MLIFTKTIDSNDFSQLFCLIVGLGVLYDLIYNPFPKNVKLTL